MQIERDQRPRTAGQWRSGFAAILCATPFGVAAQEREQETAGIDAQPYELDLAYTADLWRNVHGGRRTGGIRLDNLDLTLSVDGDRAWGIPGLTAFAYVLYTNSGRFSEHYVGDAMTVSNIDAAPALRLYEAWFEWSAATLRPLALRFGLYDLNSEFDTSDARALFIHSSHGVGHELGQTGENGPSIFPVTSLAMRVAWQFADRWRLLAAVFDGVPGDRDNPDRSGIYLSSDEGALAIVEAQWSSGRISKLSLGRWQYTSEFADLRSTPDTALPERSDNAGSYAALEIALGSAVADEATNASVFIRYGVANGRINDFEEFLGVGIRGRGVMPVRADDEVGLAFSWAGVSREARSAASSSGGRREGYEAAIELTYRMAINEWLTLQPDLQFIFNPGADPALADSLALGLRFEFSAAAWLR
jgi:porin